MVYNPWKKFSYASSCFQISLKPVGSSLGEEYHFRCSFFSLFWHRCTGWDEIQGLLNQTRVHLTNESSTPVGSSVS